MDRDALHDRIRRLLFASPALARAFARGDFRSVFRGSGIEFDSLRDYSPDDDARLIDFRASLRLGRPFVRTYREDRSLTLFLIVDLSLSMDQGSGELSKLDMAALVSSLVAYAAQFRGLPVGSLLFAGEVLGRFPPRRGKSHALAVANASTALAASLRHADARKGSDIALALNGARIALKRRSLVLLLSDFRSAGWERPLAELGRRHDLVAVRLHDPSDRELPRRGAFFAADPETGETSWLPLASGAFHRRWRERADEMRERCVRACADAAVPLLEISTDEDPAHRLLDFFERRKTTR